MEGVLGCLPNRTQDHNPGHRMRTLSSLLISSLLFIGACDTAGPDLPTTQFPEVTYRTPLTDHAIGATVLNNGDLAVYGLTEGRIAPTDGTNAFPLVLRLRPDGSIAAKAVYRDIGYGEVAGAAPLDDGLAALTTIRDAGASGVGTPQLILYRTNRDGARKDVLYAQPEASSPPHALRRTPDGGLVLTLFPFEADAPNLIKLDATGAVAWTYRMPAAQDVRAVAIAPNGDLLVLGATDASAFTIARLTPDGAETWRRTYGDETAVRQLKGFTALDDGMAVLEDQIATGARTIHLTRLTEDGALEWTRSYASGRVRSTTLATLTGNDLAFAWTEDRTPDEIGGDRAEIVRLTPQGEVQSRHPFGPQDGATTYVSALLPYPDDTFIAAGSTGPERLGGFGGDDFDVLVERFHGAQ